MSFLLTLVVFISSMAQITYLCIVINYNLQLLILQLFWKSSAIAREEITEMQDAINQYCKPDIVEFDVVKTSPAKKRVSVEGTIEKVHP